MEAAAVGGGGGGPAPFLVKTYEMVDDPETDKVVSWTGDGEEGSFVVWDPPEFSAKLLPTYFKHNNFSSFIRQLNTYGFRKTDPERWEFSNEHFLKGKKHLLKNIRRRKPIHSHSHPAGSLPDSERAALMEEIERLSQEKLALQNELWRFQQQQSGAITQVEDIEGRVIDMEQRQLRMLSFLQRASVNPQFVENLVKVAEASSVFSDMIHKKRRLPSVDMTINEITEMTVVHDDYVGSSKTNNGNGIPNQGFNNKLMLALCPSMTASNVITASNENSDGDDGSGHVKGDECERMRMAGLSLVQETQRDLSDTGTSFCPSGNPFLESTVCEDGLLSCQLSLGPASSPMNIDRGHFSATHVSTEYNPACGLLEQETAILSQPVQSARNTSTMAAVAGITAVTEEPRLVTLPKNDQFWEQFLTERPGCSDAEEASSSPRRDSLEESTDSSADAWRNRNDTDRLKL